VREQRFAVDRPCANKGKGPLEAVYERHRADDPDLVVVHAER
jgi:hypothetical protein